MTVSPDERARQIVVNWAGWPVPSLVEAIAQALVAVGEEARREHEHNIRQMLMEWLGRHGVALVLGEDMLETGWRAARLAAESGDHAEAGEHTARAWQYHDLIAAIRGQEG